MAKRGLTLGKFAPFHKGHAYLIEQALKQVDELIVLIYHAAKTTIIPTDIRAHWIKSCFPTVTVMVADGGSEKTGYTKEIIDLQNNYLKKIFRETPIDYFFASEPYGEYVARALNCRFVAIDIPRKHVNVCATEIRTTYEPNQRPFHTSIRAYKDKLPEVVYHQIKYKLYLLGAPSTGKTTLAQALAATLPANLCLEFGRYYWHTHQVEHRLTMPQLEEIALGHNDWEEQTAKKSQMISVIDTNLLTTCSYAIYYHGYVSARLTALLKASIYKYQYLWVCDSDIPFDDTWDRSGIGSREKLQSILLDLLAQYQLRYMLVSGSVAQRVQQVQSQLLQYGIITR